MRETGHFVQEGIYLNFKPSNGRGSISNAKSNGGASLQIATLPIPVIALVNGAAVGGGCEIAMACDYRVVSTKAKAVSSKERLAITTGWGGATLLFEKDGKHDRVFRLLSEAEVHYGRRDAGN